MQDVLPPPSRPQIMTFSDFLGALFAALEEQGVRFCILRNYEGFPERNIGGDVDCLIDRSRLTAALCAVRSIPGIRIVGLTVRANVAGVFVAGVAMAGGSRCLQLDFLWGLNWKQILYLPASSVLRSAVLRRAGELSFPVPLPAHEAIISLLTSLLFSGRAKEKYLSSVRQTFASCPGEIIAALRPQFGLKVTKRLVSAVIAGDPEAMSDCVPQLRFSLAWRGLLRRPLGCVPGVVWHYVREIAICLSPENVQTVMILDPGGDGRAVVIESLMPLLSSAAKSVERHHFTLNSTLPREPGETGADASEPRGSLASIAAVACWLMREWLGRFRRRNSMLRIFDINYHDLLMDPRRYGYGGPRWFARLAGLLLPAINFWILIDPADRDLRADGPSLADIQTSRQIDSWRRFVQSRKHFLILDAGKPAADLADEAYSALTEFLARRIERKIEKHFL